MEVTSIQEITGDKEPIWEITFRERDKTLLLRLTVGAWVSLWSQMPMDMKKEWHDAYHRYEPETNDNILVWP